MMGWNWDGTSGQGLWWTPDIRENCWDLMGRTNVPTHWDGLNIGN